MPAPNSNTNKRKQFFLEFFREVQHGLRGSDKTTLAILIEDLITLSQDIPPHHTEYTFREILVLIALVMEKKLEKVKKKDTIHS